MSTRTRSTWSVAAVALSAVMAAARPFAARVQVDRGPIARVEVSNDVAWLERIAASTEAARDVQGSSHIGQPKGLRVAAYARLGAAAHG